VSGSTPLYPGYALSDSIYEGLTNTYSYTNGASEFEVDAWRTQIYNYPYNTPSMWLTVKDPYGFILSEGLFYGQQTISTTYIGLNHTIQFELLSGVSSMTYQIRACDYSCPSECPYTSGLGYCNGNGACFYGICLCDNSTSNTFDGYSCYLDLPTSSLFGLWIALSVVGFLLIVVLPIVICVCCCGVCAAAANAERHPIIHHHHPSPINPAYNTGPVYSTMAVPTPGVAYVQAQPAGPYQPMGQQPPMFQGQPGQPYYQPQPQQQQPGQPYYQPQPQPSLYPKNENYEKV